MSEETQSVNLTPEQRQGLETVVARLKEIFCLCPDGDVSIQADEFILENVLGGCIETPKRKISEVEEKQFRQGLADNGTLFAVSRLFQDLDPDTPSGYGQIYVPGPQVWSCYNYVSELIQLWNKWRAAKSQSEDGTAPSSIAAFLTPDEEQRRRVAFQKIREKSDFLTSVLSGKLSLGTVSENDSKPEGLQNDPTFDSSNAASESGQTPTFLELAQKFAAGEDATNAAFQLLRKVASGIDWKEFGIEPAKAIFGESSTWQGFCDAAGEQGNVRDAAPNLAGQGLNAAKAVCKWLNDITTELPRDRLRWLAYMFSDPYYWHRMWDQVAELNELRESISKEREDIRLSRDRGTLDHELVSYVQMREHELRIYQADDSVQHRSLRQFAYLTSKLHPELYGLVPTINTGLPRPSDAELQRYAQDCRKVEAGLIRGGNSAGAESPIQLLCDHVQESADRLFQVAKENVGPQMTDDGWEQAFIQAASELRIGDYIAIVRARIQAKYLPTLNPLLEELKEAFNVYFNASAGGIRTPEFLASRAALRNKNSALREWAKVNDITTPVGAPAAQDEQGEVGDPVKPKGISLRRAAEVIEGCDKDAAKALKKRWQNSNKLPSSVGVSRTHRQVKLYNVESLAKIIQEFDPAIKFSITTMRELAEEAIQSVE